MTHETIRLAIEGGVARLTLFRPDAHNAMNGVMYDEARAVVAALDRDPSVRVVVLTGAGPSFCAGGDIKYMLALGKRTDPVKAHEAAKLAGWLNELDQLSKPLIGRINGPAYGGGLGLISVCDVAIAVDTAVFGVTETRIGMAPGMISPFLVQRLGVPNARRLFLGARRFDAAEALRLGLLSAVVPAAALDDAVQAEIDGFLKSGPVAIAATKRLIRDVAGRPPRDSAEHTIRLVVDMWSTSEAQEGMSAFVEKRSPAWVPPRKD